MKVLVVGSGGREHAIVWALSRSPIVTQLLCAPGNPGMAHFAERHSVSIDDLEGIVELAEYEEVDLVVVGPEAPLVQGLGDMLRDKGIKTFGPNASGARLEGSKTFAKELMRKANIPTASFESFSNSSDAIDYVRKLDRPVVVKADGLAAGKGVTVCGTVEAAEAAVRAALDDKVFGTEGSTILVEEKLEGDEFSVLAFTDGRTVLPMEAAQDFKRIFDGDEGPNTGGMGSYSPVPFVSDEVMGQVTEQILAPIVNVLTEQGIHYVGIIFAGLILTSDGPKVIEFNCRFGDPETQALISRLDSDIAEAIVACIEGRLDSIKLAWKEDACVCVVAASQGYPGDYHVGFPIEGLDESEAITSLPVFHAGTKLGADGTVVTAGGRVLGVAGLGISIEKAREAAYRGMDAINFPGITFRRDIAARV